MLKPCLLPGNLGHDGMNDGAANHMDQDCMNASKYIIHI